MTESTATCRLCSQGWFHWPPSLVLFLPAPDSGAPLPRSGVQTGRLALFDLSVSTYWGDAITGDRITVDWDTACPCGRVGPRVMNDVTRYGTSVTMTRSSMPNSPGAHERAVENLMGVPMTNPLKPAIPLIIRGRLIEADWEAHGDFFAPAIGSHLDELMVSDPLTLMDVHELPLDDILDFLVELGHRLEVDHNEHLQRAIEMTAGGSLYSRFMLTAIYRHLPGALRRDVLEELVEQNLARAWIRDSAHRSLAARPSPLRGPRPTPPAALRPTSATSTRAAA